MSLPNFVDNPLSLTTAQALLEQYNCQTPQPLLSPAEQTQFRQALCQVAAECDRLIFGVCADQLAEGKAALSSYLLALGQKSTELHFEPLEGPVYLKFNPGTGLCYSDSYTGSHRGVLVSCQSDLQGGINATYGHLPLDLFS